MVAGEIVLNDMGGNVDTLKGGGMGPRRAAGGSDNPGNARLRKACGDFEAILLNQLITTMRKSIPKSGMFEESFATGVFQSMQDQALAGEMAAGRGTGLGELLYRQLSGQTAAPGTDNN